MSPRRTRRGTVRENVSEVSVNSSMKSASKSVKKTRQTNKSMHVKSSEEDSDAVVEQSHNVTSNTPSARSTRKRRKDQEQTLNESGGNSRAAKSPSAKSTKKRRKDQDETLEESRNDSRVTKTGSKASKSKKQVKSRKQQVSDGNSTISDDEGSDTKNKSKAKSAKKSVVIKLSKSKTKAFSSKVTPESSPILEPPLPNRSTKTPKKSPSNLGSPKTHSRTALRSMNVPRRLTIDSPPSDASNDSPQSSFHNVDKSTNKSKKSAKPKVSSPGKKVTSPTLKVKSQLSKSPKIVFNNSKSKTPTSNKKSPSKKVFIKIDKSVKVNLTNSIELETSIAKKQNTSQAKKSLSFTESKNSSKVNTSKSKNLSKNLSSGALSPSVIVSSFNLSKSPKVILPTSLEKTFEKTPSKLSLSTSGRKSKSPKLPSSKSKKSGKFVSSFTPGKTPKIALSSNIFKTKKSPPRKEKSPAAKDKSSSKKEKTPTKKESSAKKTINRSVDKGNLTLDSSMSPKVVLNKLSISEINLLSPVVNKKVKNINGSKSPKRPSLVVAKPRISLSKSQGNVSKKPSTTRVNSTPIVNKRISLLKPLTSSTPREKVKSKQLTLSTNVKSKISKKLNSQTKSGTKFLEDESIPSMNNSSLIHLSAVYGTDYSENEITFGENKNESNSKTRRQSNSSPKRKKSGTFEVDKSNLRSPSRDKTSKNGTYEVDDPKTPKSQNKSIKRKLTEVNESVSEGQVSKKSKVQFTTPAAHTRGTSSGINRQGTPGHAIHKRTPMLPKGLKTSLNKQSFGNRSSPAIKTQLKTPGNRRLSVSLSTNSAVKSNKSSQLASVSKLNLSKLKSVGTSEKKPVSKTPARKVPNFSAIHQKKFAQMESLVDLKKRVEERHLTLNAPTSSTKKVPPSKRPIGTKTGPVDLTNGTHNRFGWPVRKNEAVDIISKKQSSKVESSDKRREKARTTLKGVRMNRRFELQMQSRMKNS